MTRSFQVLKVAHSMAPPTFLVVSPDLLDPDVWAVINEFDTAREAWRYIGEVSTREIA